MPKKEKGKTMFSFTLFFFWYTIKEWAYKVVKINGLLKVQSTLLKGKHHPNTNTHVVKICGETNLS